MPVERTTPQLVKKGKGKKRPGYRGPGGYQGGRSSRSRGPSGPPGGGATSMGSGRDFSKGPSSTNREKAIMSRGKGPKGTTGNIRDFKDTGPDRSKVSQFSTYGRNLMNQNLTRDNPARKRGLGGLGSLIMSGLGMLMGIPGLGLLTGGFGKLKKGLGSLNDQIQSTDFARSKTLMDYLDAKKYGGIDARDRAASKNMREARAIQTAMDMRPTTLDPREMARMGLQMPTAPMSKPTFSDPFANTVGTTTKVNAPANDAVSSYSYGTAGAAIPGVETTTPSYINEFLNKPITPGKSSPFNNFIDNLYNSKQILELEDQFGSKYGITNTSSGKASDARHMAAMNNLSTSLSPFDNKFGNFIGDTGAFVAGLINELPALGRGFNKQNLGEIVEDIKANYAGSFGTPNQTTAEDIYSNVFEGSTPARTASVPTYGTAAAAEVKPAIGMENTGLGFSIPTGDVGLNASGRLGNLTATVDAIDALKGESVDPQINYSGNFGNTTAYGNFSDDVQNLGLNFNNDKGLSGGISYDAITGEPRFDIGFRRTFADGGVASMFTRRG